VKSAACALYGAGGGFGREEFSGGRQRSAAVHRGRALSLLRTSDHLYADGTNPFQNGCWLHAPPQGEYRRGDFRIPPECRQHHKRARREWQSRRPDRPAAAATFVHYLLTSCPPNLPMHLLLVFGAGSSRCRLSACRRRKERLAGMEKRRAPGVREGTFFSW